jgi:type I restriction enzyme R subunit
VRNIVLLRPINSMIEFKQIIGRGTRLFDKKAFFTIYNACRLFEDKEWDGEPVEPEAKAERGGRQPAEEQGKDAGTDEPAGAKQILRIRLADGKEREIKKQRGHAVS